MNIKEKTQELVNDLQIKKCEHDYLSTTFNNGDEFEDFNPIYSFIDKTTNKKCRIILEEHDSEEDGFSSYVENNEFVVVLDGIQSTLRNEIKTSQKLSLDIYFKYASEDRKKYSDVLIEITKIMERKNAKI